MAVKKSSSYGLLKRRDFLALATSSVALVAGPWPFSRELKASVGARFIGEQSTASR